MRKAVFSFLLRKCLLQNLYFSPEQSQVRWFQSFPYTLFFINSSPSEKRKRSLLKTNHQKPFIIVLSTSILLKELLSQFCVHMRSYQKFSTPWPVFINLIPVFILSSQNEHVVSVLPRVSSHPKFYKHWWWMICMARDALWPEQANSVRCHVCITVSVLFRRLWKIQRLIS